MTEHLHPRDPRARRRAFDPVDALEAAVRLDVAADAMRAAQHTRGPEPDEWRDTAATLAEVAPELVDGFQAIAADVAATAQLHTVEPPLTAQAFADALAADDGGHLPGCYASEDPAPFAPVCADCTDRSNAASDAVTVAESEVLTPVPVPPAPAPAPVFIPEQGRRLDWRSRHDPRSLSYGVRARLEASAPIVDHLWPVGPVLDQGAEGACVGCAVADASNVLELAGLTRPRSGPVTLEGAEHLYKRAQQLDEVPGEDYTGTSVLAGMQAGVEAGLFGGYLWAFGTKDIAQAVLQRGPVVIGIPWLSGMYETGPGGLVVVEGDDVGGHCLAVVGIRQKGPQGQPGPYFIWLNSWGPDYGAGGLGYVHHRDLAGLLHGRGEAAIPTATPLTPAA
jgi:hypothetical protein